MKVKRIGDKELTFIVNSVEELRRFFSASPDCIEDVRFTLKGYDTKIESDIYIVEVLYKNDAGYWTVGFSDSDTFR